MPGIVLLADFCRYYEDVSTLGWTWKYLAKTAPSGPVVGMERRTCHLNVDYSTGSHSLANVNYLQATLSMDWSFFFFHERNIYQPTAAALEVDLGKEKVKQITECSNTCRPVWGEPACPRGEFREALGSRFGSFVTFRPPLRDQSAVFFSSYLLCSPSTKRI